MASYTTIDCCPVDNRFYRILKDLKDATGCTYQSIYRGGDKDAQRFLTGRAPCYKHNQSWIYANYPPGVANPPGRSTHECRSDGVAYPGPVGRPLFWWQCGLDIDDAHVQSFIHAASKRKWTVTITYPGSAVEYHHVNFRKAPKLPRPSLKQGSQGPLVRRLTKKLHFVHSPVTGEPYLKQPKPVFDSVVKKAVVQYQKDHHQKADGVVGTHTARQLKVSVRKQKHARKAD